MFNKLIVGVDGQEGGADAVALAKRLAAPDATIVLVHAYAHDPWTERPPEGFVEQLQAAAASVLEGEGADPRFVPRAVPDSSPARALHAIAAEEGGELIVVGSCHRGLLGRGLLGDVSRATLHGAACPVALAPRGYADGPRAALQVIGVGVDGGAPARAAALYASELASRSGAELRLLWAVHVPVAYTAGMAIAYDWPQVLEGDCAHAERALSELAAELPVPSCHEVVEASPAEALEQLSREVDLVVVGSRGWGAVRRVVLGSTSDRLLRHTKCPVLVITAPVERQTRSPDQEPRLTAV
jgi:nucleotide-binding universal stress UspA family protein